MVKAFFLVVLSLITVNYVDAYPTISNVQGGFSDGSNVIISGSNFGNKSHAAPAKWDNFNSGTNGNQLDAGRWPIQTSQGGTVKPTYSNSKLRKNDTMSAKLFIKAPQYNCSFGYDGSGERYFYISYWRHDTVLGTIKNYKHFRIYGNGPETSPQFAFVELTGGSAVIGGHDEAHVAHQEWTGQGTKNAWTREEFYIDSGTRGNSNGRIKMWRNSKLISDIAFDTPYLLSGYSGLLNRPRIGHFFSTSSTSLTSYFSETYIDNTQARVELGNASKWNNCTHREIQIPTAWSGGSISIKVNGGSFDSGDTTYLYVVDSNGNVNSNGYPVTIGGDIGVDNPPNSPTGLQVVAY